MAANIDSGPVPRKQVGEGESGCHTATVSKEH